MRELERHSNSSPLSCARLAIIGRGRLGTAMGDALRAAGLHVSGPLSRGSDGWDADIILLCVPDGEIGRAAALVRPGRLIGHCSGATTLTPLTALGFEAFSVHPLMTVTREGAVFAGAGAAIAGSTPEALATARRIARTLMMRPVEVADEDRVAYHAAASIASNLLITLEDAAERMAATAGVDRALLVPLVRRAVENWAELGSEQALTGPIARGDEATVAAQRDTIAQRTPELLDLFDVLAEATRALVARRDEPASQTAKVA